MGIHSRCLVTLLKRLQVLGKLCKKHSRRIVILWDKSQQVLGKLGKSQQLLGRLGKAPHILCRYCAIVRGNTASARYTLQKHSRCFAKLWE